MTTQASASTWPEQLLQASLSMHRASLATALA
jgi:hypothetical protein